jgi:putative sterol carrier protein
MAVKYLSEEWAKEVSTRLQASDAVKNAAKGQDITLQQVFSDVPDKGEVKAYFKIAGGMPELALGETENPEATISQTYETAAAVNKGELQGQAAFMQGKLKIQGNLMKVMQLQGFLQAAAEATKDLEIEY